MTLEELEQGIKELEASFPGKTQVDFKVLDAGEDAPSIQQHAEDQVVSASTIKPAVLACLLDTLDEDGGSLEDMEEVTGDVILDDSLVFDYGPRKASLYEIAWWMIVNSDNTAANVLMTKLSFDKINRWCEAHGLHKTRAGRLMLDFKAIEEGRNNYISPADFEHLVVSRWEMAKKEDDSRDVRNARTFLSMLHGNRDYDALLRYIYEDPECWHKSGDLDTVAHDAGIFRYDGKTWFLGVFTSDYDMTKTDYEKGRAHIGRISRLVFDYMKEL